MRKQSEGPALGRVEDLVTEPEGNAAAIRPVARSERFLMASSGAGLEFSAPVSP